VIVLGLEAFHDAFKVIIEVNRKHFENILNKYTGVLTNFFDLLKGIHSDNKYIHFVGAGRSKLAGKVFGDLMKNIGFNISYIGDVLSRPVKKNDLVIAVSSSGWTNSTLFAVEQAIKIGATVVGLTASFKSKLGRLADTVIPLPGKPVPEEIPYLARQLLGHHKTPLTPMGTISELATILFGIGVASAFNSYQVENSDPIIEFKEIIFRVLHETEQNLNKIVNKIDLVNSFVESVTKSYSSKGIKLYMHGLGICEIISKMSLMRYQHLNLNVYLIDDWILRSPSDILVLISGSGENNIVMEYAYEAVRSGIKLVGITANSDSKLAKMSELVIEFDDISTREDYIQLRIGEERPIFIPLFEFSALVFLESTVAQIASKLNISEEDMKALHANIE